MILGRSENEPAGIVSDTIAVVGMACRFAGGIESPEALWDSIMAGAEAVGEVPDERWDPYATASPEHAARLRSTTKYGSFLDDISGFDAEFFCISPREAELMDPQQRIVLELSWEALEHAGIPPRHLAGSDTGVFVGVGSNDYGRRLLDDIPGIEAWTGVGSSFCGVPNRVSYTLDLRGPSLAIDTACSASLAAIHLACQSLRAGESTVALAGGILIMAGPGLSLVLDAAGATAPDGRCKSFDASADGYGRGEGGGVVVLKRLIDARRDGDRILALIRGSAVHQDGKTNGIMAPSREAQAHLMRRAYQAAGIAPQTVSYVEAHGTGTPVGDPIEAGAIADVIGAGRPKSRPCLIGSVKPNIGHLEAGAGVAGLIKAVLALHKGVIPPTRGVDVPNPAIAWEQSGLSVATGPAAWPPGETPRRAGVSGFGYGGTIAHIVLEEAGADGLAWGPRRAEEPEPTPRVFPLSSVSEGGVRAQAARLADWLDANAETPVATIQYTLARRRAHLLPQRVAVVASSAAQLAERLRTVADGEEGAGLAAGRAGAGNFDLVWVFSGHGAHWTGMGRELLATDPVFATALDKIDPIFQEENGFSPRQVLEAGELSEVAVIQPLIFAMQIGLSAVWRSRGIRPDAVIGHSVGEIAAVVTAGILTPEEGARLVCRRSRLLAEVAGRGAMFMVGLSFSETAQRLAGTGGVTTAISAGPSSTVVAGDRAAVEEIASRWQDGGLLIRRVDSDVAFHSSHMDPLLHRLSQAVSEFAPRRPRIPVYSTALADPRSDRTRDGDYWATNLRQPVRFAEAVTAAIEDGYRNFLEISAHPVTSHSVEETAAALGAEVVVAHSLRRNKPEAETLLTNHGQLYCRGARVDWSVKATDGELLDLPVNAWQHRPFWAEPSSAGAGWQGMPHDPGSHTLLGAPTVINASPPVRLWQTRLDMASRPYPGHHPVKNVDIIPAAVLLNTFLAAGGRPAVSDVRLRVPVSVTAARDVQVVRQGDTVRLLSRLAGAADDTWLTHSEATADPATAPGLAVVPEEIRERCGELLDPGYPVDRLATVGVAAMGFEWTVAELRRGPGEMLAAVTPERSTWAAALDAALSIGSVVFPGAPALRMPAQIDRVVIAGECPEQVLISVRVTDPAGTADVAIASPAGEVLVSLEGLRYGLLEREPGTEAGPAQLVYELELRPAATSGVAATSGAATTGAATTGAPAAGAAPPAAPPLVIVFGDMPFAISQRFGELGIPATVVTSADELAALAAQAPVGAAVLVVPPVPVGEQAAAAAAQRGSWLLAQAVSRLAGRQLRLWCVTRGVREGTTAGALAHSALHGLGRVAAGEYPDLWAAVVDVPADLREDRVADTLLPVLAAGPADDVMVLRDGASLVERLVPVTSAAEHPALSCRADGTYLVTGGLGVLGLEVAAWLASRGARRLILAGRSGLPRRAEWADVTDPVLAARISAVRVLEAQGVTVYPLAVDIADRDATLTALGAALAGLPPVRGVVHAAGVLDNKMIGDVDPDSLATVLRPKVEGAMTLHELFPPGSLDFLALFSSNGQLLGLTGQASYAAGNAFLDGLARARRRDGCTDTVSLAWTSWRGLGMSISSEVIDMELAARGAGDITASEAFSCWDFAARHGGGHYVITRVLPPEPGLVPARILSEVPSPDAGAGDTAQQATWESVEPAELPAFLREEVARQVAGELKMDPGQLDVHRPLTELGLDSVMMTLIRRRLERQLQRKLPATLLWEHPSAAGIAGHLAELLATQQQATDRQATDWQAAEQQSVGEQAGQVG